jgi:hypothetical protein
VRKYKSAFLLTTPNDTERYFKIEVLDCTVVSETRHHIFSVIFIEQDNKRSANY